MASIAVKRIQKEFKDISDDGYFEGCAIKIELINGCWTELRGEIAGPPETPYEGGKFLLDIKISERYPFLPPELRFITRVWHPNISSATGAICLDILREQWAPSMTLRTVLLSVQSLLASPEPDDPQDAVVAFQLKTNYELFVKIAKHWTNVYAGGPHKCPEFDTKIELLKEMGMDEDTARAVLSKEEGNMESSIDLLLLPEEHDNAYN